MRKYTYSTVILVVKKHVRISGPTQAKPALFKG